MGFWLLVAMAFVHGRRRAQEWMDFAEKTRHLGLRFFFFNSFFFKWGGGGGHFSFLRVNYIAKQIK